MDFPITTIALENGTDLCIRRKDLFIQKSYLMAKINA